METAGLVVRVRIEDLPEEESRPKHEIIDGTLIVTLFAGVPHQSLVARITFALMSAAPPGLIAYPGINVRHVRDGEADLLVPDVAVAVAGTTDPTYVSPADSPRSRSCRPAAGPWAHQAGHLCRLGRSCPSGGGSGPHIRSDTRHGDTAAITWAVEALESADL